MKAVVDTNVVAYYLLGNVEFSAEVRRFWKDVDDALAPSIWEAELANVVWMSIRAGVLREPSGPVKLRLAAQLGINTVTTQSLWHGALLRSIQSGIAVYDALFVELAERERAPLVTFDQLLLKRWPAIACRPGDLGAK